ncbi:ATP-binding cassette-type vacuolar membrane transporter Hmt1 [Coemansia sp. RSA 2336]|nr:ATP-binding cassette-type vacuolar membrane transporter Hmt1 [Coemansia sp. RSA 2336]
MSLYTLAVASSSWPALRTPVQIIQSLQWAAAVLPGFLLLGYVAATAAVCALRKRYTTVNASDIEGQQQRQPLLASGHSAPSSEESLSTSPTALDVRQAANAPYPSGKSNVTCTRAGKKLVSRVETLRKVCNGLVLLAAAQSLVHTMLDFALRQELARSKQPDTGAIRITSWLAFAQICIAGSWMIQLRYRYALSKRKAASMQQSTVYEWNAERELFWLLSLITSISELYAYIACSPSDTEAFSPLQSKLLRTLISIRIVLNLMLTGCAAHGGYLERQYQQLRREQQQSWMQAGSANYADAIPHSSAVVFEDNNSGSKTASNSDDESENHNVQQDTEQQRPRLRRSETSQLMDSYGATSDGAFRTTPSTTSTVLQTEPCETTPLVADETHRAAHDTGAAAAAAYGMESSELSSDALKSGAKKVKMYHQSDELNHDIMGLKRRLRLLAPFLWPSGDRLMQLRILLCLLILVAGRVVNVLVPLQFKIVVDGLSPKDGSAPRFEWANVLLYTALQSLQGSVGVLSTVQSVIWIPVGQATTKRISVAMFDHLHKLSLRFHVGRKTGEILRVQDRGVTSVVSLLQSIVFKVIPTLADIALACYFFSVMFDLYFGTVVFTTMASYLAATLMLTGWRTRYRRRSNYLDNEMEARAVDSLLNFETVKYYNAEQFENKEYGKVVDAYQEAEWYSNASMDLMNMGQNLIVQTGLLAGALLSAKRVYEGQMTVGDFTMLLSYIAQLYGPLNWFGTYYRVIQKNFIDMEKLLELFDEPVEVKDPVAPAKLEVPQGEVVFENVSFSYDKQPTLKNVSFKVPAGSTVAIVGPSGSGKSTILRLLFRFYDVQSGRILIDGQDIRSVQQTDLRQAIGIVPQDTVLFNDSIRYNIAYGLAGSRTGVAMKDVVEAADAAHIHNRIMRFSERYETRVGERGQRLSGGEKQRVAIARTLLKDPRIVCLDEATSALDTATERQIQTSLREMTKNRTTLIIAHRLSTVIHADQILIVQNGEIVERGTHTELINDCDSVYYDMWMKQLSDAANASYDRILESAGIEPPMAGAMTPDFPPRVRSPLGLSAPQQPAANSLEGEDPRQHASANDTHEVIRRARDSLHLALDGAALPRVMMTQGWNSYGPLTDPLPSSMNQGDVFGVNTASPAVSTSSLLSAAEIGGLKIGVGTAGIPVDGAAAEMLDSIQPSPGDMSFGMFTSEDVRRIQQQKQQH